MGTEEDILRRISPTSEQRAQVRKVAAQLMGAVRDAAKAEGVELGIQLVGSVAKDTYVFKPDIDIFVMFPETTPHEEFVRRGLRIGKRVLQGEERYAEHPYTHGVFEGFDADIVPCYSVKDPVELKSAVDRTPFHTEYIKGRLREEQKDEVRLLKQFMKGIGVYGAEAKTRGFSGYLVELLILKYGDFRRTLKGAKTWRNGTQLSLDGGHEGGHVTPLIFFDPVDVHRNVASALSLDAFATFIVASHEYLAEESVSFFFPEKRAPWSRERIGASLGKRGSRLLAVRLRRPDLVDDNLYPQVRKSLEGMIHTLREGDFVVLDSVYCVSADAIAFLFELERDELSGVKEHRGPPVWVDQAESFVLKWRGAAFDDPYVKDGRWMVHIRRPFPRAADLMKAEISKAALGNDLKDLASMEVLDHEAIMRGGLEAEVTELLDRTYPWRGSDRFKQG